MHIKEERNNPRLEKLSSVGWRGRDPTGVMILNGNGILTGQVYSLSGLLEEAG